MNLPMYTLALWAAGVIGFPSKTPSNELSFYLPSMQKLRHTDPELARSIQNALEQRPYLRTLETKTIHDPFKR